MGDYLVTYYTKRDGPKVFEELHKCKLPKLIKKIEDYFKGILSGDILDSLMPEKKCTLCIITMMIPNNFRVAGVELRGKKIEVVYIPVPDEYKGLTSTRFATWKN